MNPTDPDRLYPEKGRAKIEPSLRQLFFNQVGIMKWPGVIGRIKASLHRAFTSLRARLCQELFLITFFSMKILNIWLKTFI